MKTTPTDFRRWQLHIRKECVNCNRPDRSETIKPWSVNWTLLGRILPSQKRLIMEWVKCLDRMPEPYEPVLIFTTDMNQAYAWLGDGRWYYEHQTWFLIEVLYWMPLPLTRFNLNKMKTPDEILAKHEDNNEMHFHQVDRQWIIEAMKDFAFEFAEAAVENWGLTKVERIYLEHYYKKITQ